MNLSSFQALAMFRRGLFYSYLSIYLRYFLGLTVTETTLFATFPMILNILFQTFVWGAISDRFQRRRTLVVIGEISASIGTFCVWYLHTMPETKHTSGYVVIIGLSLVEIFWSMSNVGWSALLSDLYPERRRAGIRGTISSLGALGNLLGVWTGGLAYDGLSHFYDGWGFYEGPLFFIASGIMAISTIPMLFLPEGGVHLQAEPRTAEDPLHLRPDRGSGFSISREFLVFLIAMTFINFGRNSIALLRSQYLVLDEGFDLSSRFLSYVLSMGSLGVFIFGISLRELTKRIKDETLLIIGTAISISYLLGFALARNLPTIFLSSLLGGVAQVTILATSYAYASKLIPPERRGKQFALFNATFFLSWGIPATLIVGPLVDKLIRLGFSGIFSYKMAFFTAAVLVIAGTFILVHAIRLHRQKWQH